MNFWDFVLSPMKLSESLTFLLPDCVGAVEMVPVPNPDMLVMVLVFWIWIGI